MEFGNSSNPDDMPKPITALAKPGALDLAAVNSLSLDQFVNLLGSIYEKSPWIAARAWAARPFSSSAELGARLDREMRRADRAEQLSLIRAHPELTGRLNRSDGLTAESTAEQAQAGLDQISTAEAEKLLELNSIYQSRFGFPFIICARLSDAHTILKALTARAQNEPQQEIETALNEISKIAALRLADKVK